jgi:hypothetical protein
MILAKPLILTKGDTTGRGGRYDTKMRLVSFMRAIPKSHSLITRPTIPKSRVIAFLAEHHSPSPQLNYTHNNLFLFSSHQFHIISRSTRIWPVLLIPDISPQSFFPPDNSSIFHFSLHLFHPPPSIHPNSDSSSTHYSMTQPPSDRSYRHIQPIGLVQPIHLI